MKLRYELNAREEIKQAREWWSTRSPQKLRKDLTTALDLLRRFPNAGEVWKGTIHRKLLTQTGYYLYYEIDPVDPNQLNILSLWSAHRGTGPDL